jgi:Tat protein translocase TatB subunit
MFGMTFGELLVIAVIAMIVLGPKKLPGMLRKGGRLAGSLRRKAGDLRRQSGIDDMLRDADITSDIQEIRKLARGEIGSLQSDFEAARGGFEREARKVKRAAESGQAADIEGTLAGAAAGTATLTGADGDHDHDHDHDHGHNPYANSPVYGHHGAVHSDGRPQLDPVLVMERQLLRQREYPEVGADDYGAIPDCVQDIGELPAASYATDSVYLAESRERIVRAPADAPQGVTPDAELAAEPATDSAANVTSIPELASA